MRDVLFLINTHFQLITALQLVRYEFNTDNVDLVISDNLNGYKDIIERLKDCKIIRHVYQAEIKELTIPKNGRQRIKSMISVLRGKNSIHKYMRVDDIEKYDVFLFHNLDFFSYILYDFLKLKSKSILCRRFEEGFSIYLSFNDRVKSQKVCDIIFRLFRRNILSENIESIYLYHEELLTYHLDYPIHKIPLLNKNDSEFKMVLNKVFGYKKSDLLDTKAVIFEECFFVDGNEINDFELFKRVAEYIGYSNVSVKLHPRNKVNRFNDTEIQVLRNSAVPWEIMQMNNDYRDKVFITITSGSVLASFLYFGEIIPTVFLYKLVGGNFKLKHNYECYLDKLCLNTKYEVYIPNSLSELENVIKEII